MITRDQIVQWLQVAAAVLAENKETLTALDAAIGDGDHGINMDRGFRKVLTDLQDVQERDIGAVLKATGMALISSVGGASGPLYGTFFLAGARLVDGKLVLTDLEMALVLDAGVQGVVQRGRAQQGDKTMLDALIPAAHAFRAAVDAGYPAPEAARRSYAAAAQGAQDTIPMVARKGRASYLGERSVGHQDPGSASACLIWQSLVDVLVASLG
jgi:dihydroxyacetone kinase-like protein